MSATTHDAERAGRRSFRFIGRRGPYIYLWQAPARADDLVWEVACHVSYFWRGDGGGFRFFLRRLCTDCGVVDCRHFRGQPNVIIPITPAFVSAYDISLNGGGPR